MDFSERFKLAVSHPPPLPHPPPRVAPRPPIHACELESISGERTLTNVMYDAFVADSRQRETFIFAPPADVIAALINPKNGVNFILAFNYIVAIVFLVAAIVVAAVFVRVFAKYGDISNPNMPLWLYDHATPGTATKTYRVSEKTIAILCVVFLALTSLAHFVYAANFGYSANVVAGTQPWRWIEYGVTATIMVAIVSILSGVRDANAFLCLLVACVSMILTGAWWEATRSVTSLVSGFALLAIINVVIIRSFVSRVRENTSAREETPSTPKIPRFVWAAVISTLALFSCFGVVPLAQYVGLIVNPVAVETVYIVLSITSKLLLASLVSWGFAARLTAV